MSIISCVKAFVPVLKTVFKKGTNAFTKLKIDIGLLFKMAPIMIFLESAGQNLCKTTLTCSLWIIIVDFRLSCSLIPIFFGTPCT